MGGAAVRVLVACERSGRVRDAFIAAGHDAYSVDIMPALGCDPCRHIVGDALRAARNSRWDLLIAHPPCTYLTNSAAWAFKDGPYHQSVRPGTLVGADRRDARAQAYEFFLALWNALIPRVAIENPIGVMSTLWRRPDQVIQPYQFGDDASKATCLWLRGLPPLVPTGRVPGRWVNGRERWANQTDSGQNRLSPSDDRAHLRAVTYPGIAAAMATQWGDLA